jgi:YVTN family beta-propeller protein
MGRIRVTVVTLLGMTLAVASCSSAAGDQQTGSARRTTVESAPTPAALPAAQRIRIGSKPCGVLVVGDSVWVSVYADNTLVRVDRRTGKAGPPIPVGLQPCGLAFGAGSIWVEDYGSSELTQVDASTGRVRRTTKVGGSPFDVTFADGAAWVTDNLDGTVSRVDAASGRRTVVPTGGNPIGIIAAGGAVWAGLGTGQVARIDPRTAKVTDRLDTGAGAGWTAASGDDLWVMNGSAGTVSHIDARTGAVLRTVRVGPNPLDGDAADGVVWVPLKDGTLVRLDARTDGVTGRWTSGVADPFVVDVDHGQLWTADFLGTDLVQLVAP